MKRQPAAFEPIDSDLFPTLTPQESQAVIGGVQIAPTFCNDPSKTEVGQSAAFDSIRDSLLPVEGPPSVG